MPELPEPMTQQQLLDDFSSEWSALMAVLGTADGDELMAKTDAADWNVRDHVAHLGAWLQSVIVMIRDGQPQWTGLGAPPELFSFEDYDPLNEAIRQHTIDASFADVLDELRRLHDEMTGIVASMSDEDLLKPVDDFVAGGGDFAICYKIDGNGPYHYREHREWIREILN